MQDPTRKRFPLPQLLSCTSSSRPVDPASLSQLVLDAAVQVAEALSTAADPPPPETDMLSPHEVEAVVGLLRYKAATLKGELALGELKERQNLTRTLEQVENAIHTLNTQLSVLLSLEQWSPTEGAPRGSFWEIVVPGFATYYAWGTKADVEVVRLHRILPPEARKVPNMVVHDLGPIPYDEQGNPKADLEFGPCNGQEAFFLDGSCNQCGWPLTAHTGGQAGEKEK